VDQETERRHTRRTVGGVNRGDSQGELVKEISKYPEEAYGGALGGEETIREEGTERATFVGVRALSKGSCLDQHTVETTEWVNMPTTADGGRDPGTSGR